MLSMHKYPSNVIEKFLETSYENGLLKFIEEFSNSHNKAGKYFNYYE